MEAEKKVPDMNLLKVKNLNVEFHDKRDVFCAVDNISFSVKSGRCLGIVGESGAGKSTAMLALMNLLPDNARVNYDSEAEMLSVRDMAMIFQDPSAYLNPSVKVGRQITETVRAHQNFTKNQAKEYGAKLLDIVGIRNPLKCFGRYPFELSGGMQQRVAIAIALACEPKLLIADEPTTALDATIQKQILDLLKRIQEESGTAMIIVTHDLSVAATLCSDILVMKDGKIVEEGSAHKILREPANPYTGRLLDFAGKLNEDAEPVTEGQILLNVDNVSKQFENYDVWYGKHYEEAVDNVSLQIKKGEIFGVVGESGSGKTTLSKMVGGIIEPSNGVIKYKDVPVSALNQSVKKEIQMIFQHNYASFDPRFTLFQILSEPLMYQADYTKSQREELIANIINGVGLKEEDLQKYPYQFSGGQRQRIGIGRALISQPELVICDEPVSSLDITIQGQILKLLKDIQQARGLTYLFISHDLNVINHMCQRVGVMYFGNMVETGNTRDIYREPWHPYTKELLNAIPEIDPRKARRKKRIPLKDEGKSKDGCPYASKCGYAMKRCRSEKPKSYTFGQRSVACFLYSEEHSGNRSTDYVMTAQI